MSGSVALPKLPLPPTVPSSTAPNPRFAEPAGEARIQRTAQALIERGFTVHIANGRSEAIEKLRATLPPSGTVLEATSQTLLALGVDAEFYRARGLDPLKARVVELMMGGKADEARRLGAAPDVVVGSVHAVTEAGQLLVASATGSQLGPYSYGAGQVVWVVGTQKIVEDLDAAEQRLEEYSFPLENARAQKAYGRGSMVGKILLINREARPGRATIILVRENLGF